jgi:predicted dehydrogenase
VDAVSIALPSDVQVLLAVRAARAGRHLLLEKPLALFGSGADELLGVVTEACCCRVGGLLHQRWPCLWRPVRLGGEGGTYGRS